MLGAEPLTAPPLLREGGGGGGGGGWVLLVFPWVVCVSLWGGDVLVEHLIMDALMLNTCQTVLVVVTVVVVMLAVVVVGA